MVCKWSANTRQRTHRYVHTCAWKKAMARAKQSAMASGCKSCTSIISLASNSKRRIRASGAPAAASRSCCA